MFEGRENAGNYYDSRPLGKHLNSEPSVRADHLHRCSTHRQTIESNFHTNCNDAGNPTRRSQQILCSTFKNHT